MTEKELEKELETVKCTSEWSIEDVHNVREVNDLSEWTDKQAYTWLKENAFKMHDHCVERGWDILEEAIIHVGKYEEYKKEKKNE